MNYRIVSSVLGHVAIIIGCCMFCCLPWGLQAFGGGTNEGLGVRGLVCGGFGSIALGSILAMLGRGADKNRLYRKEAIVIVGLSWILAVILGATPYLISETQRAPGIPMSIGDAFFESASGLTTTGATVFSELENKEFLPRCILFWRMTTHFLGGLGVVCFFVALLGQGGRGKTALKIEHSLSGKMPASKMKTIALYLFSIYVGINATCCLALLCCGLSLFDAISHAFSVSALGGFSTRNASVLAFSSDHNVHGAAVELVLIFFMLLSGTNYWLIFWTVKGRPEKLFRDSEQRLYLLLIFLGIVTILTFGIERRDFLDVVDKTQQSSNPVANMDGRLLSDGSDDLNSLNRRPCKTLSTLAPVSGKGEALRSATFQVISLATGSGFATYRYEYWNATSLVAIVFLMFVGGCSGSAAGGAKVFRILLCWKAFFFNLASTFSPNVVRAIHLDDEYVDKDTLHAAVVYLLAFLTLISVTAAIVISIEPDQIWLERFESQVEKTSDIYVASLSMYANVGPALGVLGSFENYGALSEPTKFIFGCASLLGRLEIWTILALLSPNFWRNR